MIGRIVAVSTAAFALAAMFAEPAVDGSAQGPAGHAATSREVAAASGACRGGQQCGMRVAVGGARPGLVTGPWRAEGAGRWLSLPGSPGGTRPSRGAQPVSVPPGAQANAWRTEHTPNPVLPNGSLAADACTGPASCVAVGGYEDQFGTGHALAERWNGTGWAVQRVPDPAGAIWTGLTGISCASAASCTAVGWYISAAGRPLAVAYRWDGAAWAAQSVPSPAGSRGSVLAGISCAGSAACTAVGQHIAAGDRVVALAERWNGKRWSVQPFPAKALDSELSGVSCPTLTSCVAVGAAVSPTSQATLAARWNGTTWTLLGRSPEPAGAAGAGFNGIFCRAPRACMAVGDYGAASTGGGPAALAESWNGTGWTIQPVPVRSPVEGTPDSVLSSVWCDSAGTCAAVGGYAAPGGTEAPLAESWNGGWARRPAPAPAGSVGAGLSGVSCATPADCHAVGVNLVEVPPAAAGGQSIPGRSLAEAWHGTGWTIQVSADLGGAVGFSELSAVACTSPRACFAVGDYVTVSGAFAPLAEQRAGSRWVLRPMPNPAPGGDISINGISCVSARDCVAVGSVPGGSGLIPLIERWNGVRWRIQSAPAQTTGTGAQLFGVSCTSDRACVAVGDHVKGAPPFAERWDGNHWRSLSVPAPARSVQARLSGVSCTAKPGCMAVGYYFDASGRQLPLAENWNGNRWTVRPVTGPAGATLSAVSCTATTACTAVGSAVLSSGAQRPLARHWNGRSWSVQPAPTASPNDSWLNAVSCGRGSCAAVGGYNTANGETVLLIDAWDGTRWQVASTVNPAPALDSILNAVACPAPGTCVAVGSDLVLTNVTVTLAMRG